MTSIVSNSHEIKIQILNIVSKFSVDSETNVVSKMIAGPGPRWLVFRIKAHSAQTQKVSLSEFLYYSRESLCEPFEKYASPNPAGFENLKTVTTL